MDFMGALHKIKTILASLSYREEGVSGEMFDTIRALFSQGLASDKLIPELRALIKEWWPEIREMLGTLDDADLIREHDEWLQVCNSKIDVSRRALLASSLYNTVLRLISHAGAKAGKLGQEEARGSVVGGIAPVQTRPDADDGGIGVHVSRDAANTERPKPKPKGRKATDPKGDKRVCEAWETGEYKTYAELANAMDISKQDVQLAIDRVRHERRN